jgi:ankyrin repeat protein
MSPLSPLSLAIQQNKQLSIIKTLVRNGATVQNTFGWGNHDALLSCVSKGDSEKFFAIIENATAPFDLAASYHMGINLLTCGLVFPDSLEKINGFLDIFKFLIENAVPFETTLGSALETVINSGNMPLLEFLINSGANINHIPRGTSLIFSAIGYHATYIYLNSQHCHFVAKPTEALTLLLDLGLSQEVFTPKTKDRNSGFSPLGYALHIKANEAVQKLIEYGADVDGEDLHGYTPLIRAIESNNIVGVQLLLESDANIYIQKPIELAHSKGFWQIFELLLDAEAKRLASNLDTH